jgi:HPt (histidine-containing phosphotransfer) domain-containing protein
MGKQGEMPIVALTANAIAGMREMFLQNGFSDFLSKPIEIPKLAEIMEKWIPAEKRGPAPGDAPSSGEKAVRLPAIEGINTQAGQAHVGGVQSYYLDLLETFCRDTQTRLPLLAKAPQGKEERKAFTTQVHALKSALTTIGAGDLAKLAARLEDAGRKGDIAAINDHLDAFRKALKALLANTRAALARVRPAQDAAGDGNKENTAARELLAQLKTALTREDLDTMDKTLEDLKALPLPPAIREALPGIVEAILSADFKKAAAAIETLN